MSPLRVHKYFMYRFAVDYCVHVLCLLVWQVIDAHFEARPLLVAGRLATVAAAATRVAAAWAWEEKFGPGAEKRGDVLRREVITLGEFFSSSTRTRDGHFISFSSLLLCASQVSSLGVVFVKVAQTLATREDLVGAEAAAALGVLQVSWCTDGAAVASPDGRAPAPSAACAASASTAAASAASAASTPNASGSNNANAASHGNAA
jgi:hypothetical protein